MTNTVKITLAADASGIKVAVDGAQSHLERLGQSAQVNGARAAKGLDQVTVSARDLVLGAAGVAVVTSGIAALSAVLTSLPAQAFDYSKNLESSAIGMAGILGSMTAINGKQTDYNTGLAISRDMIKKLGDDALRTAASSSELTNTFQALLAPGLAARMTLEQIRELTVVGTNAVKSIGLSGSQIVQELRDLVGGGITAAGSQLATALGLRDEDIAKAKASSEGLFAFLMERMKGFETSSEQFGNTLQGRLDSVKEGAVRVAAQGMAPLTQAISSALGDVAALFVSFDENKNAQLNPQLVESVTHFGESAATALTASKAMVGAIWEHRDALLMLWTAYKAYSISQWSVQAGAAIAAKLELAQASRLGAVQAAAEAVGNEAVTQTSRQKVAAYLAELQARQANAQATVAESAAKIASMNVSLGALDVSRAEVVAKLEATRVTQVQAQAQLAAATAAGAQSYALAMVTEATTTLGVAQTRSAALMAELAVLGRQQASVQATIAGATAASALATNEASVAQARLAAATGAAGVAGRAFGAVTGALGGPVGIAIMAVSGLVMWLVKLKGAADDAAMSRMKYGRAITATSEGKPAEERDIMAMQAELERIKDLRDQAKASGDSGGTFDFMGTSIKATAENFKGIISSIEGDIVRVKTVMAGASAGTDGLSLSLNATQQAWEKTVSGAKSSSAAQDEYKKHVDASRLAFDTYKQAAIAAKVGADVIAVAQKKQSEAEKAFAKERDDQLKSANGAAAKSALDAVIAHYEQLQTQISGGEKAAQDIIKAQHTAGLISDADYYARQRDLALVANQSMVETTRLEMEQSQKSGLAKADKLASAQKYSGELVKLGQAEALIHAKYAAEMMVSDAKLEKSHNDSLIAMAAAGASEVATLDKAIAAQQLHNAEIGKTPEQIALVKQAIEDRAIAELQANADILQSATDLYLVSADFDEKTLELWQAKLNAMNEVLERSRLLSKEQGAGARAAALDKQNKDELASTKKMWESIDHTAQGVFTNIFNGGQNAFDKLRDTLKSGLLDLLYQMTVKKWIFNISASVGGAGMAGVANAAGEAGGVSGLGGLSALSGAKSLYDAISGGFASLGASVSNSFYSFATSSAGQSMGLSTMQAMGPATATGEMSANVAVMTESASKMASAAGSMAVIGANIIAGNALNNAISNGHQISKDVSNVENVAIVAASIFGGPLGGVIAGSISGLLNAAFGTGPTSVVGTGLRGSLSTTGGLSGSIYTNTHADGGWFSSDDNQTHYTGVTDGLRKYMNTAVAITTATSQAYAKAIGLSADVVTGFTRSIDVNLMGLDAAGQKNAIDGALAGFGNDMVKSAYGAALASATKEGEESRATLSRLASSLTSVNAVASTLRQRLFAVSVYGADAASKLADLFTVMNADGTVATTGLAGLNAASAAYYNAFFSDAEKAADSTKHMTDALAGVNLTLPASKEAFRAVAASLDLNTDAGRKAYAVLLGLAPEFAQASDDIAKLARETAARLLATFTVGGALVPALNLTAASLEGVASTVGDFVGTVYSINKVLGDAGSGVLKFGATATALGAPLSNAQQAAAGLTGQINALKASANIDFAGLSNALANVNTETFMGVLDGVFKNLGDRFKTLLDGITGERVAVRDAAINIINPTVMSKAAISRGVAGIDTALPSNSGVVAAQKALTAADALVTKDVAVQAGALARYTNAKYAVDAAASSALYSVTAAKNRIQDLYNQHSNIRSTYSLPDLLNGAVTSQNVSVRSATSGREVTTTGSLRAALAELESASASNAKQVLATASAQSGLNELLTAYNITIWQTTRAQGAATAAAGSAKQAALDYAKSLQTFAIDASKSVSKLTKLREETVKYYEQQQALANLMTTSAAGLRKTVDDYRYSTLSADQQLVSLQGQFSSAYSLAMATQGDGESLAGYADKVGALLGPLIDKLGEVGKTSLINNYLAQADAVSTLLEATAPVNYQSDSLNLLGSIDTALAALDASSRSAEQIIADAIRAGADNTASGLRSVIAAILHPTSVPAFAMGGYHAGGVRLVGEHGPEMEFTGPSYIANAHQTRGMLSGGGGNGAMVQELQALRAELAGQRRDMQLLQMQIVTNTGKTARILDRFDGEGMPVRNAEGEKITVEAAV